jgi:hypothetical protein
MRRRGRVTNYQLRELKSRLWPTKIVLAIPAARNLLAGYLQAIRPDADGFQIAVERLNRHTAQVLSIRAKPGDLLAIKR